MNTPPYHKRSRISRKYEVNENDECGICLTVEGINPRGKLDCCEHYYCFTCIMEWARVESRCPTCRQHFSKITRPCKPSFGNRDWTVRVTLGGKDEIGALHDPSADVYCTECSKRGDDDLLLLCDMCNSAAHTYCVGLGRTVPRRDWYCHSCEESRNAVSNSPEDEGDDPMLDFHSDGAGSSSRSMAGTAAITEIMAEIHPQPLLPSLRFSGHATNAMPKGMKRVNPRQSNTIRTFAVQPQLSVSTDAAQVCGYASLAPSGGARTLSGQRILQERIQAMRENKRDVQSDELQSSSYRFCLNDRTGDGASESIQRPDTQTAGFGLQSNETSSSAKAEIILLVKTHLKPLSRRKQLGYDQLKEIARVSMDTILAACELEHSGQRVHPFQRISCSHPNQQRQSPSLVPMCCNECFVSFVKDVVDSVADKKVMSEKDKVIGLTAYEQLREERIAQNKQFLVSKGLDANKYQFSMLKKVHEGKGKKERSSITKKIQPRRSLRRRDLGHVKDNPSQETESHQEENPNNEPKLRHGEDNQQSEPKVVHEEGNQHNCELRNEEDNQQSEPKPKLIREEDDQHNCEPELTDVEDIPQKGLEKESKLRELYLKLKEKFEGGTSNQPPNTPSTFVEAETTRKHKLQNNIKSYRRRGREARERGTDGKKPFLFDVRDGRHIDKSSSNFEGDTSNQPPISPSPSFVDASERSHGHDAPPVTGEKDDQSLAGADITRKLRNETQEAYRRSREREEREKRAEGKKPYLVEVSNGKPIGKNSLKWSSKLGLYVRSHLDVSVPSFSQQNRRNIDLVIRNMENTFETVGGKISMKYYKNKMRTIMNNYKHTCRKMICNGTDRNESLITPNQWQALKNSMQSEDYLKRSVKSKRARSLVRKPYIYGQGGIKVKEERSETNTIMPNELHLNNTGKMTKLLETTVSTSFRKQNLTWLQERTTQAR